MAAAATKAGLPPQLPIMAALTESGMRNLSGGDRDSIGFFQMRTSIWNQGEYAGYGQNPDLQLKWFISQALAIKEQRLARGESAFVSDSNQWGLWIADVERPQRTCAAATRRTSTAPTSCSVSASALSRPTQRCPWRYLSRIFNSYARRPLTVTRARHVPRARPLRSRTKNSSRLPRYGPLVTDRARFRAGPCNLHLAARTSGKRDVGVETGRRARDHGARLPVLPRGQERERDDALLGRRMLNARVATVTVAPPLLPLSLAR